MDAPGPHSKAQSPNRRVVKNRKGGRSKGELQESMVAKAVNGGGESGWKAMPCRYSLVGGISGRREVIGRAGRHPKEEEGQEA
jgi:hypothetical protein